MENNKLNLSKDKALYYNINYYTYSHILINNFHLKYHFDFLFLNLNLIRYYWFKPNAIPSLTIFLQFSNAFCLVWKEKKKR